jgi:DNA-binding Xre family transcriptional regulator
MSISYNKLWKLMIDKNINKTKLREEAGISSNAMAKLGKNESVRVDVLVKICNRLGCKMDDIMEIVPDSVGGEDD